MNVQESIIALLQGDLTNKAVVKELLRSLAESGEGQDILLKQISLTRRMHSLGFTIAPSPAVDARILDEVARLETHEGTVLPTPSHLPASGSLSPWWLIVAVLSALLAGIGVGHFWTEHIERGNSMQYSAVADSVDQSNAPANNGEKTLSIPPLTETSIDTTPRAVNLSPGMSASQWSHNTGSATFKKAMSDTQEILIQSKGPVHLVSPNGLERFQLGSTVPIKWEGGSDSASVVLQFSSNGGKTWNTVGENLAGRELLWKVPQSLSGGQYLMKVSEENSIGLLPRSLPPLLYDTTLNIADFSPDGSLLAVPDYRGAITVWDVATWKPVQRLVGHTKSVIQVTFSPDGRSLVSTSLDGTARLWDVVTGAQKHQIAGKGTVLQVAWTAAYHPNGNVVALGNDDGTVTLWDAVSGNEISTFKAHAQAIRAIYYNRDGTRLLMCSTDGKAGLFDAESGMSLQLFAGHNGVVNGVAMTRDDSLVITSGFDGFVKFWDVKTGALIRTSQYFDGDKIGKIVLSSDDKILAVGGFGRDVKLVDPGSGTVLATLPITVTNKSIGAWPIFSGDSQLLAVCHENDVLIWKMVLHSDISDREWTIQ